MRNFTLTIVVTAFLVSGCELVGPSVKVTPPKVKVENQGNNGNKDFCPPGQAKKGNC